MHRLRDFAVALQEPGRRPSRESVQQIWITARTAIFGNRDWYANSPSEAMGWPMDGSQPIRGNGTTAADGSVQYPAAPPRFELPGEIA